MHKTPLLDDLWSAMQYLYAARYKSQGSQVDISFNRSIYPNFDTKTFEEIAGLQTKLQSLISRLEKE